MRCRVPPTKDQIKSFNYKQREQSVKDIIHFYNSLVDEKNQVSEEILKEKVKNSANSDYLKQMLPVLNTSLKSPISPQELHRILCNRFNIPFRKKPKQKTKKYKSDFKPSELKLDKNASLTEIVSYFIEKYQLEAEGVIKKALFKAIEFSYPKEILEKLARENKENINIAENDEKNKFWHWAILKKNLVALEVLFRHGANCETADHLGNSAEVYLKKAGRDFAKSYHELLAKLKCVRGGVQDVSMWAEKNHQPPRNEATEKKEDPVLSYS